MSEKFSTRNFTVVKGRGPGAIVLQCKIDPQLCIWTKSHIEGAQLFVLVSEAIQHQAKMHPPRVVAGPASSSRRPPAYGSTLQSDPTKYPFVAPKPKELQGYIDAAIISTPIDPQAPVTLDGVEMKIEDLPTADLRAMFGYGHFPPFSHPVVERSDGRQWPYTPNMCLLADNGKGVWIDPQHLACPGCGLDMT